MVVEVGEFFALNYPTLEGGFTCVDDDLDALVAELRCEYAFVDEPQKTSQGCWIRVYEHEEV